MCGILQHPKESPINEEHFVSKMDAVQLQWSIPIFAFGDEGQALRKTNAMVLGWEPVLGKGTQLNADDGAYGGARPQQLLNFVGSTWRTRVLFSCMHSKRYRKNAAPLHAIVEALAADLDRLQREGLQLQVGQKFVTARLVCLGFKGDLPALRKVGRLTRHHLREKQPHGVGLCHLCMANTVLCPEWHTWKWIDTLCVYEPPYAVGEESALTRHITDDLDKGRYWIPDPFHTFHKGVHAELAGSAIATCHACFMCACSASVFLYVVASACFNAETHV